MLTEAFAQQHSNPIFCSARPGRFPKGLEAIDMFGDFYFIRFLIILDRTPLCYGLTSTAASPNHVPLRAPGSCCGLSACILDLTQQQRVANKLRISIYFPLLRKPASQCRTTNVTSQHIRRDIIGTKERGVSRVVCTASPHICTRPPSTA